MSYDSSGTAIALAAVVTRHGPSGAITGAVCFHNNDIRLPSARVIIDIPLEMGVVAACGADDPAVREVSEEEALTSTQRVRFRVAGGASPLFLIQAE